MRTLTSLWKTGVLAIAMLAVAGCDNKPKTDVKVDKNGVQVDTTKKPGDKAVEVEVKSGGKVDVNIDRDAVRDRIEERREDRQERLNEK